MNIGRSLPHTVSDCNAGYFKLRGGSEVSARVAVTMQSEAPLTLILSPLRAGRGELEGARLGSLLGDPAAVPPKVPLSFLKGRGLG